MFAETVYLFRHALLRDAAHQLQVPSARARLHLLALEILEELAAADKLGSVAADMAEHARVVLNEIGPELSQSRIKEIRRRERGYLDLAAEYARKTYASPAACRFYLRLADHVASSPLQRVQARLNAARMLEASGERNAAEEHVHAALAGLAAIRGKKLRLRTHAQVLLEWGSQLREGARPTEARKVLSQALAKSREAGDKHTAIRVLANLAEVVKSTGNPAEAEGLFHEAGEICRRLRDEAGEGLVTGNLANLLEETGRVEAAEKAHRAALAIHRKLGDRRAVAKNLGNLGRLLEHTGRIEEGEQVRREALETFQSTGDRHFEAVMLTNIASMVRILGRTDEAESLLRRSLALHRELGNSAREAFTMANLAVLNQMAGRYDGAEEYYREAIAVFEREGQKHTASQVLINLGGLLHQRGKLEEAEALYNKALTAMRELNEPAFQASALRNLAIVYQHTSRLNLALASFRESLVLERSVRNVRLAAVALAYLGALKRDMGWLTAAGDDLGKGIDVLIAQKDLVTAAMFCGERFKLRIAMGDIEGAAVDVEFMRVQLSNDATAVYCAEYLLPAMFRLAVAQRVAPSQERMRRQLFHARQADNHNFNRKHQFGEGSDPMRVVAECDAVLTEIENAFREQREPMVFNGYLPVELTPALRSALLDRLRKTPKLLAEFSADHPTLLAQMQADAMDVPVPEWSASSSDLADSHV